MHLQMGIIKIEVKIPELVKAIETFKKNRLTVLEHLADEIKGNCSNIFNQLLKVKMDLFLGQPDQAGNKKNVTKSVNMP